MIYPTVPLTFISTSLSSISSTNSLYSHSPGAAALIDEAIRDGNKITVLTALPRPIAVQILKKAGLSPLFQGRIDPENLISPLHLADFKTISSADVDRKAVERVNIDIQKRIQTQSLRDRGESSLSAGERNTSLSVSSLGDREGQRFDGAAVIKCCGLMRKPGGEGYSSIGLQKYKLFICSHNLYDDSQHLSNSRALHLSINI